MSFTALGISPTLIQNLAAQNCVHPYPIQSQVIPLILKSKDVLGIAKTGSGKTLSYVLPIIMKQENITNSKNRHVDVLIVVPTRELAIQVDTVFKTYKKDLPFQFKSMAVFGGVSINPQMIALQNVSVLIATPGRLLDLIQANAIQISSVSTFVLDEADKLLNLGFKEELDKIIGMLPIKRQNLLFSATLSDDIQNITQVALRNPIVINTLLEESNTESIVQKAYLVTNEKKGPLLRYLFKTMDMQKALVFVSSAYQADHVADKLTKNGIEAKSIHSKKSQSNRNNTLEDLKSGKIKVLVTTDLLSRGIDIEALPFVINYELPRSPKDFIHRVGRTGRAELSGNAISFITGDDLQHFKVIEKKMKIQTELIDAETFNLHGF